MTNILTTTECCPLVGPSVGLPMNIVVLSKLTYLSTLPYYDFTAGKFTPDNVACILCSPGSVSVQGSAVCQNCTGLYWMRLYIL